MSFGPQNNSGYGALYFAQGAGGGGVPDPLNVSTITTSTITATNFVYAGAPDYSLPFTWFGNATSPQPAAGQVGKSLITLPFSYRDLNYTVLVDYMDVAAATNPGPADVFGVWGYPVSQNTFYIVSNNSTAAYKCGYITSGYLVDPIPPPA